MNHFFFFAQAASEASQETAKTLPQETTTSNWKFFLPIFAVLIVIYFLMILPQKREKNRWNDMVNHLKKNDRVLMSCGIIGFVHSVQKEQGEIILKVDDTTNAKMTFSLGAVTRVLPEQEKEKA